MTGWLLDHAPYTPFREARTARPPGLMPLGDLPLAVRDPDHPAQMAERRRLLAERPEAVLACRTEGAAPAAELAARLGLSGMGEGALRALGLATAEDWCLLAAEGQGEYRLVAAVLCFPSRWSLAEKMGRPLTLIHAPVPDYDADLAKRVNRVFRALRPEAPLWRVNWTVHATAELHLPASEAQKGTAQPPGDGPLYLRTERQTLSRLPQTGAVAFGIKTSLCPLAALTADEAAALSRELARLDAATVAYRVGADILRRALAQLAEIAGQGPAERPS